MTERAQTVAEVWTAFLFEVNRATASLMYLLQGMEIVRNDQLPYYNALTPDQRRFIPCFPRLSYVDVPPSISGASYDLNAVLDHEGEAEQLAFKGWVEQVYFLWEARFRNDLRAAIETSHSFRPETDPIGDFRRIRNDLIHNHGLASEERSGKCTLLKWFEPGERIVLGMRHVLDFLNQLGFMHSKPPPLEDGSVAAWRVVPGTENALLGRAAPNIVSVRTSLDHEADDGTSWHVVSVVFGNGVHCDIAVSFAPGGRSVQERADLVGKTSVDANGDLRFATGEVHDRQSLYQGAVIAMLGGGPKMDHLGVRGPLIRISKQND